MRTPSGYLTVRHGKSPFLIGKPTINGPVSITMLDLQREIVCDLPALLEPPHHHSRKHLRPKKKYGIKEMPLFVAVYQLFNTCVSMCIYIYTDRQSKTGQDKTRLD